MTPALRILQELTTGYSIFENNQVLTAKELNSVTNYLNDQARLNSIYLLGVGVVSGLQASLSNNEIKVTKGIGITTDGDLLYYSEDTVFDHYTLYDKFYPKYDPFFYLEGDEEKMISVYELISQGGTDSRKGVKNPQNPVLPLSQFATDTQKDLSDMVAVLLMESYENNPDICTGTDCDNLGNDCVNTPKLLLAEKTAINALLKPTVSTPSKAYRQLSKIVADRPIIPLTLTSASELAQVYRTACSSIHTKILTQLAKIYPNCSLFIADIFPSDPIASWTNLLNQIQTSVSADLNLQYYYDFLKDVVETYNLFRELLFGDSTWCCPDSTWFPKHLLLGNLIPENDLEENRTTFYPSPLISQTAASLNHAKFLIQTLDTLLKTFQVPVASATTPIRITPSLFEDQPLEERAIPYYYQVNQSNPIYRKWNYNLHQRGMDAFNYSYNANAYTAQGGAANPLTSQIGQFPFFRIEGHLGQSLSTAFNNISEAIKANNLPFSVLKVTMGELSQSVDSTFKNLLSQHPEIEHFGGVLRGGTFVLLADTNNETVIADFMLPYLPMQQCGSICTLLITPTDNLTSIIGSIADGQDAHICLQTGTYSLSSGLRLQNKGHLTITGSGKGTRIIAPTEAAIEFSNCKSVAMSNCYLETGITTEFANLKGVLTFINCPSVELENLFLRCAHQVVRSASCITVRQDLSISNTQVRIRHCDLTVGYQQIGILLVNVERSQIEDNKIQVDLSNASETLLALTRSPSYRLSLLPRLIANAYLGTSVPKGGATLLRYNECNVRLDFAEQFSILFKSDIGRRTWSELLQDRIRFAKNQQDLLNQVKQLARQILLDDKLREQLPTFNNWYQRINQQSSMIADQGIVVAGFRAQEVRILNNTMRGFLQGIHVGVSPRSKYQAGSILITGNRLEVVAPIDKIQERHGIYISSCDSLIIENNYLQATTSRILASEGSQSSNRTGRMAIEGIRVSGRLGRMVIIRQNHLAGFPVGIYFNPLDNYDPTARMQWLVSDNIASSAQTFMKVVSNLSGTAGTQVMSKVQNTNNFQ